MSQSDEPERESVCETERDREREKERRAYREVSQRNQSGMWSVRERRARQRKIARRRVIRKRGKLRARVREWSVRWVSEISGGHPKEGSVR